MTLTKAEKAMKTDMENDLALLYYSKDELIHKISLPQTKTKNRKALLLIIKEMVRISNARWKIEKN